MGRVIVIGYLSIDNLEGQDGKVAEQPGGAALYAALGARAAGAEVTLLAAKGEDWPSAWDARAARVGLNVEACPRRSGPTRRARLTYAKDGTRASPHHADAAWWERTEALMPPLPQHPLGADDVLALCPMPTAHVARALDRAGAARAIADTSEAFAAREGEALRRLLPRLFLFAPSDAEAALLGPLEGCAVLLKQGGNGLVLRSGQGESERRFPSPRVAVIDPTGAGDATLGAIAGGLARGATLEEAVAAAVEIGARAVTARGPAALGLEP